MTRTLDSTTPAGSPDAGRADDAALGPPLRRPWRRRRHRVLLVAACVAGAVVLVAAGGLVYQWRFAGPHQVSGSTALERFRAAGSTPIADPGALRPKAGVYPYTGTASEHVSFPPLTHTEGPNFPGTVSYSANGCWTFRLDYSDLHWQSNTYCPSGGNLVESGRAGWYRWNVGTLAIADTATFTCQEMAVPAVLAVGEKLAFGCSGTNAPIDTGVVSMTGTNQYIGPETVQIGGTSVVALHFRETATLSGGQSGTSVADTWMSTQDGLPVRGTWSTTVRSPSPLGTSTLTGSGSFRVRSLTPRT